MKYKIILYFSIVLFFFQTIVLHAENVLGVPNFFLSQRLNYPGFYQITGGAENNFFEFLVKLKSYELSKSVLTAKQANVFPDTSLQSDGITIRFSPVLYKRNKTYVPAFSFFYGNLNYAAFIKKIKSPCFDIVKPSYQGITFLPKNILSCSKASGTAISRAVELSLDNFNFLISAEQKNLSEYCILRACTCFKTAIDKYENNFKLGLTFNSAFFPIKTVRQINYVLKYNQIYGAEFLFFANTKNNEYKVNTAFYLNKNHNINQPAFSGRFEFDFLGKYIGVNTGLSIKNKDFFKTDRNMQKQNLTFFIQPKLSIHNFKVRCIYNFLEYDANKKINHTFHTGGMDVDFKYGYYNFVTGFFAKMLLLTYDLKFTITNPVKTVDVFYVKTKLEFDAGRKNMNTLKNYRISSGIKINCSKDILFCFSGNVYHKNLIQKNKRLLWSSPEFFSEIAFEWKHKFKYADQVFKISTKVKNISPFCEFGIFYIVQTKTNAPKKQEINLFYEEDIDEQDDFLF